MKLAVKQPYLFPYIGYFQVINIADKYVLFDDVNYINRGWINRNRILVNNNIFMFTLPLKNASQNRLINEIFIADDLRWADKLLKTIDSAYRKAPMFKTGFPIIENIIRNEDKHLSSYINNSIKQICSYLQIETPIISSSVSYKTGHLKSQEKILGICLQEKADIYIDSIGAIELYSKDVFQRHGIKLFFLKSKLIQYSQFSLEFSPFLSILDVIMFNETEKIRYFLNEYELI